MDAPGEMAFRFIESARGWVRERQVGLRLKKFGRVGWAILCEWRPFWITLLGPLLGGGCISLQNMSCPIESGLQEGFWSF